MAQSLDITGHRFGRLVAVRRVGKIRTLSAWECDCDCGNVVTLPINVLRSGRTRSCKCLLRERQLPVKGGFHSKVHRAWVAMISRCENPKNDSYSDYGGRGISVCSRWRESFVNFLSDMGEPKPNESIDRINNSGNYEPGNCRWTTRVVQQRNRRNNAILSAFGESKSVVEWAEDTHCTVSAATLYKRIEIGWSDERAISEPCHSKYGNRRWKAVA